MNFKISVEYNGIVGVMENIEKFLTSRRGVEIDTNHNRRTIHVMSVDYSCETHVHLGADGGGEEGAFWYLNTVVHHDGGIYIRNRVYLIIKLRMHDTPVNSAYVGTGPSECEVEFLYDSAMSKRFAGQAFYGLRAHLSDILVFPHRPQKNDVTDWTQPIPTRSGGPSMDSSSSALNVSSGAAPSARPSFAANGRAEPEGESVYCGDAPSARPSLDNIGVAGANDESVDYTDAPSARPTMEILGAKPPLESANSVGVMPPARAAVYAP
jgi:hypothetical protein